MSQKPETLRANMVRVAGVLLIFLLGAGGYYAYTRIGAGENDATTVETAVIDNTNTAALRMARNPNNRIMPQVGALLKAMAQNGDVTEGVSVLRRGTIMARHGPAYIKANPGQGGKRYIIDMKYVLSVTQSWGTPEQYTAHYNGSMVLEQPDLAVVVELTAQQKQQLAALPSPDVVLTPTQRQQLESLVLAWDKAATPATKTAAETALLAAIQQIGAGHLPTVRAAVQQRLTQIPKILTAAQLAKAAQELSRPRSPATAPAMPTTRRVVKPVLATPVAVKPAAAAVATTKPALIAKAAPTTKPVATTQPAK